jgi:hypothetical protein
MFETHLHFVFYEINSCMECKTLEPTTSCELHDGGLKGLNNVNVGINQEIRMSQHSSG